MERELSRKTKNIPWINQCPTINSSQEKIFGFAEDIDCSLKRIFITTTRKSLSDNNTACDPRKHSCTCCRYKAYQTLCCIYSSQAGENRCQSHTPNLPRASIGKKHINMPAHAPEWLLEALGLFFKAMTMIVRKSSDQPLIKVISIRSNPGKEVCERQTCLDSTWPTTREPGSHQHDTRQDSRRFLLEFFNRHARMTFG